MFQILIKKSRVLEDSVCIRVNMSLPTRRGPPWDAFYMQSQPNESPKILSDMAESTR